MRVLLPALAAGAAARSHRVAVLVSGTRSYTNATWDSLKTHVLDALEARGTAYEAFACGEPGQAVPPFATEVAASHATPEARLAACYAAAVGKAQSPRRWGPPRASAPFTHFLKDAARPPLARAAPYFISPPGRARRAAGARPRRPRARLVGRHVLARLRAARRRPAAALRTRRRLPETRRCERLPHPRRPGRPRAGLRRRRVFL